MIYLVYHPQIWFQPAILEEIFYSSDNTRQVMGQIESYTIIASLMAKLRKEPTRYS